MLTTRAGRLAGWLAGWLADSLAGWVADWLQDDNDLPMDQMGNALKQDCEMNLQVWRCAVSVRGVGSCARVARWPMRIATVHLLRAALSAWRVATGARVGEAVRNQGCLCRCRCGCF